MTTAVYYAMLRTFSNILNLLNFQWHETTFRGRNGYMLFFDSDVWEVDRETKEILPWVKPEDLK